MSRSRVKNQTRHGLVRMEERLGITDKKYATKLIRDASKNGLSIADFPEGQFKEYLKSKDLGKRIKIHGGNVYIFNKNSDKVITVYPIPDEYKEEYVNGKKLIKAKRQKNARRSRIRQNHSLQQKFFREKSSRERLRDGESNIRKNGY